MNAALKAEMNLQDWYDAYGTTGSWGFAIADFLADSGAEVPAHWEYRQGLAGTDTDTYEYQTLTELHENGHASIEDITHLGNVLLRYSEILQHQGRSY